VHEISIVEALIKSVQRELQANPDARVCTVHLRIGSLRQVLPEILEFCFEAATRDTPLAGARLEIQTVEAAARCRVCSLVFDVEDNWFECPRCHALGAVLLRGDELDLMSLELEQARREEVMQA
jgi:hydrogenase nickel incorporation protein HypA/HybF